MESNKITYFAETDSRNKRVKFGIKANDRSRHSYIIGKTGMGKSTVLENMAIQDIRDGNGMAFLDPHGKTADLFLEYVPENRIKDVVYFAPFDTDFPVSFNVMEDVGADKRHLVANGLMSAFKKIWVDAWSARMEYILNNILLALLEYPDSTLIGVNRMLADKEYRNKVVNNITDPSVKSFWVDEFAKYGEKYMQEAGAAIQNKIGQFISNPLVRNIIGQPKSTFDIRTLMDSKKIMIINLSKGRMGEANANLLGSMLITKIYLGAMSRAEVSEDTLRSLPEFYLYVDEFQNFANESFADILSEARKYKLALTVAHQYIEQMAEEVRAAVFGNVGTMISFRVGAYDAEVLEKEFAPQFTAQDMVNLGRFQIYMKLMIDGVSSQPFSATTLPQAEKPIVCFKDEIIANSRATYARPRADVEDEIKAWHEKQNAAAGGPGAGKKDGEKSGGDKGGGKPANTSSSFKNNDAPQQQTVARNQSASTEPQQAQSKTQVQAVVSSQYSQQRQPESKSAPRNDLKSNQQPIQHNTDIKRRNDANQRENDLRKAMSLDFLKTPPPEEKRKNENNTNKVPTKENIQGLREALLSVIKDANLATSDQSQPKQTETQKKSEEPKASSQSQQQSYISPVNPRSQFEEKAEIKKPKEIPEDILKALLRVESE